VFLFSPLVKLQPMLGDRLQARHEEHRGVRTTHSIWIAKPRSRCRMLDMGFGVLRRRGTECNMSRQERGFQAEGARRAAVLEQACTLHYALKGR
jgi:hypothetical protein